jgi:hypothetical protein
MGNAQNSPRQPTNPDPMNRPMPTYADRGRPAPSRPAQELLAAERSMSQAAMGRMPEEAELSSIAAGRLTPPPLAPAPQLTDSDFVGGKPLRTDHPMPRSNADLGRRLEADGPNYQVDQFAEKREADDALWLRVGINADLVPPRVMDMMHNLATDALPSFVRHNLEYRDADQALGYRGQFAEISHVVAKLRKLVWDDQYGVTFEHVASDEVRKELKALIGHALLALDLLKAGNKNGK